MAWAETQCEALKEIEEKICAPSVESPPNGAHLISLTPSELRQTLLAGETTLPEVVAAFHARKQEEMNVHRSLTDVFFVEALEQARLLQSVLPESAEALPLLGFVLSIKDSILMNGTRSTCGLVTNYAHVFAHPAPFIDYLREKGALILSKGNIPQGLMAMETHNNVFGEALNPLDRTRTPGGSSGGDAAQVLLRLTNAGMGSDGAGSLRIPALFCGLVTVKVTSRRFASPIARLLTVQSGEPRANDQGQIFGAVTGAMMRRVADLTIFMRVFNDYHQRSRYLPPVPWREPRPLRRVGILAELKHCPLAPINRRALDVCRERLLSLGVELVELDLNDVAEELHRTVMGVLSMDKLLEEILSGRHHMPEPALPFYAEYLKVVRKPAWLLRLLRRFIAPHRRLILDGLLLGRESNFNEMRSRMEHFRQYFIDLFTAQGVEVALFGALPPALLRGTSQHCSFVAVYMFIWNFVDFVAGALPVVRVEEGEEEYVADDKELEAVLSANMKGSKGLPVGIQVIGLPYSEEEVLRLMAVLEEGVGYQAPEVAPL